MKKIKNFENTFVPYVNEVKSHQLRITKYKIENMFRLKIRITRDKLHTSTVNSHLSGPHLSGYLAVHTFGLEQIYLVHLSLN